MPYDLSDDSGADRSAPVAQGSNLPTGRPSDAFRPPVQGGIRPGTPGYGGRGGASHEPEPFFMLERPTTPIDGTVRTLMTFALIFLVLALGYLLFGVWTGQLADPNWKHLYKADDHVRIMNDLGTGATVLRVSMLVALVSMLFLFFDEESLGYILVSAAVFMNIGIPWLSQFLLTMTKSMPSPATTFAIGTIDQLAWFPAVPGVVLIVWDLIRRALVGLYTSKSRHSNLRYGQNVAAQIKRRNVFLGACWNMPYCREPIRARCPIFIKHRGPCWRYKQGCMCEESIAKLATTPGDWKASVSSAINKIEKRDTGVAAPGNPLLGFSDGSGRPVLSWGEKKQRCRECLIYNTHQEQKYKALTAGVFVGLAAIVYFFNGILIQCVAAGFGKFNAVLGQMSLTNNHGNPVFAADVSNPVCWFILAVIVTLILSKLLQMVEYCCFTLKI